MSEKLGKPRAFRQWQKNQERLEYAEKLGMNCSELINGMIDKHFADHLKLVIQEKQKELQKALTAPVP